jgi:ADP-ribosyl-[dinitrogen reductase] hydrolase
MTIVIVLLFLVHLVASSENIKVVRMSKGVSAEILRDKIKGSMLGFYIGDALAMPVHWYYDTRQLVTDFGKITKYEAPKLKFLGSIMNLSNTGGGGRGSDKGEVVGNVILHGKKQFWLKGGNFHYHHGMKKGENTVDALVTKVLTRSMVDRRGLDVDHFRQAYIDFMTTPGTHTDTYAGTCHRMFFKNWSEGKPPAQCPDNDKHNVDSIDALMTVPAVVCAAINETPERRAALVRAAIQTTRNTETVLPFANLLSEILTSVLKGEATVRQAVQKAGLSMNIDIARQVERSRGSADPMTACYVESAFPVMLFMAYKYSGDDTGKDLETVLLASANAGGENVARGSILGAIMGAASGASAIPTPLVTGLALQQEYDRDLDNFINIFAPL